MGECRDIERWNSRGQKGVGLLPEVGHIVAITLPEERCGGVERMERLPITAFPLPPPPFDG